MTKDYALQAKIVKRLNQLYPTMRIDIISLKDYNNYYAVKCNVTEYFMSETFNNVSTFRLSKKALKGV